jgi:hypothetical protein
MPVSREKRKAKTAIKHAHIWLHALSEAMDKAYDVTPEMTQEARHLRNVIADFRRRLDG